MLEPHDGARGMDQDPGYFGSCSESGCYESARSAMTPEFQRVGNRQGDYEMVQNYYYVGEGGSYEKETVTTYRGWRVGRKCILCLILTLLFAALVLVCLMIPPRHTSTTTTHVFDCDAGVERWRTGWSEGKKSYCCAHFQRGCTGITFDCDRHQDEVHNWSVSKRAFCCASESVGCPTTTTGSSHGDPGPEVDPFDCQAGIDKWKTGWSHDKKGWCCDHHGVGCTVETSKPFDCEATPQSAWSESKRIWCCTTEHKGCTTTSTRTSTSTTMVTTTTVTTTLLLFDCKVAYANWERAWSDVKKDWCCARERRGCPHQTTTERPNIISFSYDCEVGSNNWKAVWTQEKKDWCCHHDGIGCNTFNCKVSRSNALDSWTLHQRTYCCAHHGTGCGAPAPAPATTTTTHKVFASYDCSEGYASWTTSWDSGKQAWCCEHAGRGCPLLPAI